MRRFLITLCLGSCLIMAGEAMALDQSKVRPKNAAKPPESASKTTLASAKPTASATPTIKAYSTLNEGTSSFTQGVKNLFPGQDYKDFYVVQYTGADQATHLAAAPVNGMSAKQAQLIANNPGKVVRANLPINGEGVAKEGLQELGKQVDFSKLTNSNASDNVLRISQLNDPEVFKAITAENVQLYGSGTETLMSTGLSGQSAIQTQAAAINTYRDTYLSTAMNRMNNVPAVQDAATGEWVVAANPAQATGTAPLISDAQALQAMEVVKQNPNLTYQQALFGGGKDAKGNLIEGIVQKDWEKAWEANSVEFTKAAQAAARETAWQPAYEAAKQRLTNEAMQGLKEGQKLSGEQLAKIDAAAKAEADKAADAAVQQAADANNADALKAKTEEAMAKEAEERAKNMKAFEVNVGQYALLILEALEQRKVDDATKKVKVKGADEMQDSQGTPATPYVVTPANEAIEATTIASAAQAMKNLLQMGTIDIDLLSTSVAKKETQTINAGVSASAGKSGSGVSATTQTITTATASDLTTEEEAELRRRRSLLVGEWATAAAGVGEGSNAISAAFYERAAGFAAAANEADGSLGGITAIGDTDRFVLFEVTRGAALSAMSLGLQSALNLNDMSDIVVGTTSN